MDHITSKDIESFIYNMNEQFDVYIQNNTVSNITNTNTNILQKVSQKETNTKEISNDIKMQPIQTM